MRGTGATRRMIIGSRGAYPDLAPAGHGQRTLSSPESKRNVSAMGSRCFRSKQSVLDGLREELDRTDPAFFFYLGLVQDGTEWRNARSVAISDMISPGVSDPPLAGTDTLVNIERSQPVPSRSRSRRCSPGTQNTAVLHYSEPLSERFGARRGIFVAKTTSNQAASSIYESTQHSITHLGDFLHSNAKLLSSNQDEFPLDQNALTRPQHVCLYWTARGKTSWETGRILGRSEATVNYHLQNAIRRLQASNKVEAVYKASVSGLLAINPG